MHILAQETNNAALLVGVALIGGWMVAMTLAFRRAARRRAVEARTAEVTGDPPAT